MFHNNNMKWDSLQKIYRRAKQVTKYVEAIIIIVAASKESQDTHKIQMGGWKQLSIFEK